MRWREYGTESPCGLGVLCGEKKRQFPLLECNAGTEVDA
jgi:hypothetical protein